MCGRTADSQTAKGEVQGQCGEEDFEGFGECGGGVVGEKGAYRSQQKRRFCRTVREKAARQVGNEETGGKIEQNLNQKHCPKIVAAKDGKDGSQERRISGKPGEGGGDHAGVGDAVNAMLEPVPGDIGVEAGVVDDGGKAQDQKEPEGESDQAGPKEKPFSR